MRALGLAGALALLAGACASPESNGTGTGGARTGPGLGGAAGMMNGAAGAAAGGSPGSGGTVNGAGGSIGGAGGDGTRADAGGDRPDGMGADLATDAAPRADGGTDARVDGGADARADGVVAYSPCPTNGTACIVMPLGDSITDGFPYENGSYRVELFHQAVQGSTPITFVGRNLNGPANVDNLTFPRGHEGYSGFTIDSGTGHSGISPLVDAAISMFHPHIVLLHIGTNDINGNIDPANAPTRLGALIDRINNDSPATLVVVAQIIPTTNDGTNTRISTYNNAIPALVQARAAAGKHVMLLDMYTTFTSHTDYKTALMFDGLHPNVAGYATMGDAWYAAISALVPRR